MDSRAHLLIAFCAALSCLAIQPAAALTNKVLIIGIDGTMPSAVAVARTPNLDALKSRGSYSTRVISHPVTHSAASWSSMFTGVWGDKHGVNDPGNSFAGNQFTNYPSFYKRLEAANSNLNTLAFARWAPMLTAVPEADVKLSFDTDAAVTDETCRRLTNSNPDVFWMLLLDVDSAGHSYGWGAAVSNYVKAIETADSRVGQMVNALTNRVTYQQEDWLIIVTTDHGEHDHPDPERSRITFVINSGPSAARGEIWPSPAIVDICATVLTHMHVPIQPAWNLDARVEGLPLPEPGYETNLIFNPNAESNSGTNNYSPNRGIAWWFDLGNMTLANYGSHLNFPTDVSPGPPQRAVNFFLGGASGTSIISQIITVTNLRSDIDAGEVDYELSGYFGGFGSQSDTATLGVNFLGLVGQTLGSNGVGGVTAAARSNVTGLLRRSVTNAVPAGTRKVEFVLTASSSSGANDASADDLSFVLTSRADRALRILRGSFQSGEWQVRIPSSTNRVYRLERSQDLANWTALASEAPGTGDVMIFSDTLPPAKQAFYRVRSERR